jgi:nucleoside-diphosphate-sugar epimerase
VMVNRSGKLAQAPVGVDILAGDLGNPDSLLLMVKNCTAIYFCAQPAYHRWPEEFPALHQGAIELAARASTKLIVAENLYGYGPVAAAMTEEMPLRPNTRKGVVRAQMHETLMQAYGRGKIQVAVARGSDFFGPFVAGSAVGSRAFRAVIAGKAVEYNGDADFPHSYTFVTDFGTALATLGTDDRSIGQVWHVPNAPIVSTRDFFSLAFQHARQTARFRKVSILEMRLLGLFIPPLREMVEMIYEFEAPFIVDHRKFDKTFGPIATPLTVALKQTVEWTKDNAK